MERGGRIKKDHLISLCIHFFNRKVDCINLSVERVLQQHCGLIKPFNIGVLPGTFLLVR